MELNFSELESTDFDNGNYWVNNNNINTLENENQPEKKSKKKVSFGEILSNMRYTVNKDGSISSKILDHSNSSNSNSNSYTQQKPTKLEEYPLDKNSYIYNKYFRDYNSQNEKKNERRQPRTREEFQQMVLDDRIQREKISQIKSKNLTFTNAFSYDKKIIQTTRHNLNRMSFG